MHTHRQSRRDIHHHITSRRDTHHHINLVELYISRGMCLPRLVRKVTQVGEGNIVTNEWVNTREGVVPFPFFIFKIL